MLPDLQYYVDPQFLVLITVGIVLSRPRQEPVAERVLPGGPHSCLSGRR